MYPGQALIGAVLSQKQSDNTVRPIAFASRTLQPPEKNYGVFELERLGVVWAVKHFRHYLLACFVCHLREMHDVEFSYTKSYTVKTV